MRNIKEIINDNTPLEIQELPKGHREEFLEKLSSIETLTEKKTSFFQYWKAIAAAVLLVFSIGIYTYATMQKQEEPQSSLFAEMKSIEDKYLQDIALEWKNFRLTANDEHLVSKYEERMATLDTSYQELKKQFLAEKNSLNTLEKMIKNLQMRLSLLQEIQQHLKRLQDEQSQI